MKTKSILECGTVLLLAAILALAWRYARSARQARLELADLAEKSSVAEAAVRRARGHLAPQSGTKAGPKAGQKDGVLDPAAVAARARVRQLQAIQNDPKMSGMLLAVSRAQAAQHYARFYGLVGLTPDQIGKFEDNLAKFQAQRLDLGNVLQAERTANHGAASAETTAAVQALMAQAGAAYQADQLALLGPTGTAQLADYERTLPAQNYVSELAGNAVVAGIPMSTAQRDQLLEAMTQASASYQAGNQASVQNVDWSMVDAQAKSFLSDSQLDLLQSYPKRTIGQWQAAFQQAAQTDGKN